MCEFGILILGGSGKGLLSRVSGSARQNLSPTWEYYLGTAVRPVRVKFGIRNVRCAYVTDI